MEMLLLLLLLPLASSKPNLVLILLDDMGWGDPGYQNFTDHITPNMDRLAREYLRLDNYYNQPICTPTRSALMAGKYPARLGTQHSTITIDQPHGVGLEETFLSERLQRAGYETHVVGKWHLGFYKWLYTPLYRGFETFYGFLTGSVDYNRHSNQRGYDMKKQYWAANGTAVTENLWEASGTHCSRLYEARIDEIITERDQTKPLFLYYAMKHPHGPIQPPYGVAPGDTQSIGERYTKAGKKYDKWKALITDADNQIGHVIQSLKRNEILGNTVVMIMSDNGGYEGRNGNLRGFKRSLYDGGIRSPAIIYHPSLRGRGAVKGLYHITDVHNMFTRLARCGFRSECDMTDLDGLDGRDPFELVFGDRTPHRAGFLVNIDQHKREAAYRLGDYKVIIRWLKRVQGPRKDFVGHFVSNEKLLHILSNSSLYTAELYNMVNDEEEKFNLADVYTEKVEELVGLIREEVVKGIVAPMGYEGIDKDEMKRRCDPNNFGGAWWPWGENMTSN